MTDDNKKTDETQNPVLDIFKKMSARTVVFIILAAGLVIIISSSASKSGYDPDSGCAVPNSYFTGNAPVSQLMELTDFSSAQYTAGYEMEYPSYPREEYTVEKYAAALDQELEVWYEDEEGNEGIRMVKGKLCDGSFAYTVKADVDSKVKVDVGDYRVTEYGDGENLIVAEWEYDGYTYQILCLDDPMPQEEVEALILQMK